MVRPVLELADILREHGPAWREANRGHASLDQLKVMSAIERCRTAALGGHVARCENAACGHTLVAFNSCRDRHCPKCQAAASRRWLADREAELLPVPYFHVVYTLPSKLRDIAYQNKRVVYDLLMKAAAETTLAIAANPRRRYPSNPPGTLLPLFRSPPRARIQVASPQCRAPIECGPNLKSP